MAFAIVPLVSHLFRWINPTPDIEPEAPAHSPSVVLEEPPQPRVVETPSIQAGLAVPAPSSPAVDNHGSKLRKKSSIFPPTPGRSGENEVNMGAQSLPAKLKKKSSIFPSMAGPSTNTNSEAESVPSKLKQKHSAISFVTRLRFDLNQEPSASKASKLRKKSEPCLSKAPLDAAVTSENARAVEDASRATPGEPMPPGTPAQASLGEPGVKIPETSSPAHESPKFSLFSFSWLSVVGESKPIRCLICTSEAAPSSSLKVPCGHHYCDDCVRGLIQKYNSDESFHPLRCCKKSIPVTAVKKFIPSDVNAVFEAKRKEFSIAAKDRIYCCRPACSTFLGSSIGRQKQNAIKCPSPNCRTSTCPRCKEPAHPNELDCTLNKSTVLLNKLVADRLWQKCPGCQAVVERTQGCSHMHCRCGAQFCYRCGGRWKMCRCK